MRGKLWFISGLAAGFVLGSRAGREKYEEIVVNAKKVWEHPTIQEAAGVAQAQANKLYSEGKDKIGQTKFGEKLATVSAANRDPGSLTAEPGPSGDTLAGSSPVGSPRITPASNNGTTY